MTNSVAFLCSFFLLIVLLSSTDGQWNDERWNGKFPYDERRNNERSNNERWNIVPPLMVEQSPWWNIVPPLMVEQSPWWNNHPTFSSGNNDRMNERWNNERWNDERSRSDDEIRNNERYNNERRNNERSNNGRRTDERENNNDRRYDEIRSDESRNNEKSSSERRNDERGNDERPNDERRNDERRNYERRNDERQNDERRNDNRQNDERRNDDRRNDERRNDDRRNDERRNDDRRNERPSEEKRNDERRNNQKRNDERRNNGSSGDERSEEERLFSFADKCPADKMENWTYRGNNGVLMWTENYPECGGRSQSPVAINYYQVTFLADMEKLKFYNYQTPIERATIENDGHTIQITPGDDVQRVIHLKGTTYRLREVHFHWGDDGSHGSEHTINFDRFALEMHLVHQSGNGRTAVVAVLFREQDRTSKELQNITQNFSKLMYKDNRTEIKSPINLNNLLPANPATYFWYEGSLTTPPCTEGVQWVLLRDIMTVGAKQMAKFRKLYSARKRDSNEHCKISNNYRPLQALNGRIVVVSR